MRPSIRRCIRPAVWNPFLPYGEHADVVVGRSNHRVKRAYYRVVVASVDCHVHVRLPGAHPNLAYQHVVYGYRLAVAYPDAVRTAVTRSLHHGLPLAVRAYGGGVFLAVPRRFYRYLSLFCVAFAPYRDCSELLHHHSVREYRRQLDLRRSVAASACEAKQARGG